MTVTANRLQRRPTTRRGNQFRKNWFAYVLIALLLVFLLFPVYWMLLTALLPTSEMLSPTPPIVPNVSSFSLEAFVRVFEMRPVGQWLYNSFFVTVGATIATVALATMAGYSLSRLGSKAAFAVGYSLFAIRLIPVTLLVIPLFMMFSTVGLTNSLFGLVIANTVVHVPFAAWIMKSIFDAVPVDLEEAALIDGSSRLRAFLSIVLPLARPGIGAIAILSAILTWNDFAFARTLMQGDAGSTVTVGMVSFIGEYTADWGALMAAAVVSIVPMVVLFIILEPLLVSGMTDGAVK